MNCFWIIFWVPKLVYHSPKPFDYRLDCEGGLVDAKKAFFSKDHSVIF